MTIILRWILELINIIFLRNYLDFYSWIMKLHQEYIIFFILINLPWILRSLYGGRNRNFWVCPSFKTSNNSKHFGGTVVHYLLLFLLFHNGFRFGFPFLRLLFGFLLVFLFFLGLESISDSLIWHYFSNLINPNFPIKIYILKTN